MLKSGQFSFFNLAICYKALFNNGDRIESLVSYVPWEEFRAVFEVVLRRRCKRKQGGGPPFVAVLLFKVLVLQALYNLSDDQAESQIRDRLLFMQFLKLDLDQSIPDAKTIWLFRETHAQAQVVETLFAQLKPIRPSTPYNPVASN